MPIPRKQQISLDHTPYYHCTTRCVRRAFLCGKDAKTGVDFSHRKTWLEKRIRFLTSVFAIDLIAYAVMSNHYHVVVRIHPGALDDLSNAAITKRWRQVFALPATVTPQHIAVWRERLGSLSWFMRCINEPLARLSNKEDQCTGRFWEGRFKCQALLDEQALIRCMTYVDLNPIRAAIAATPESSEHTSIKARIEGDTAHLMPFRDQAAASSDVRAVVPLAYKDYVALVDWTGRQLRHDKRGHFPLSLPPILDRLGVEPDQWTLEMRLYGRWYYRAVGSAAALQRYCEHLGQRWLKVPGRPTVAAT